MTTSDMMEAQVRVLIVINTRSGGLDSGLYEFAQALGLDGAEVTMRFATQPHVLESLVCDASEFDRIVAAGGDGTISAISYATRDTGVPILAYPAGTANLISMNLGLPLDAPSLASIVLAGHAARFDLGELEHPSTSSESSRTGFALMAGAGFDAAIMENAKPLKSAFGAAAYLLAAVTSPAPTVSEFELVLDGEHVHTDGIAVLLVNFGRIQFDLDVTRGWDPQDGRFEVIVLRTRSVAGLIPVVFAAVLDKMLETPEPAPSVDVYSASEVQVSAYPQLRMQSDGDVLDVLTPFAARVLPGATTLLVPEDSQYRTEPTSQPDTR